MKKVSSDLGVWEFTVLAARSSMKFSKLFNLGLGKSLDQCEFGFCNSSNASTTAAKP